ncbi:MAG: nucleotide pyrophosphohydrolase [Candidatus Hydrothermota bacterium]|nr:MAG: nucleotide pyrophosphohydrolase [Candidatus Hydrothermae bacterium]
MEIKEFQEVIKRTYLEKDKRRGAAETFRWFVEEVGELAKAIRHGDPDEMLLEFSDVMAWLFSLANIYGIDMEAAASRYEKGCPKCGNIPCTCDNERKHP